MSNDDYRAELRRLDKWEPFLLRESNLPGPRANLELVWAVAHEGECGRFERLLVWDADRAPSGSREEFLAVCGTVGLGSLLAAGERKPLARLRRLASDPRWRVREGVAMALQLWGDADMETLLAAMADWSRGSPYEQRAAAAGLCEPRLLRVKRHAQRVLRLLDAITASIRGRSARGTDDFAALKKGLGYCWSVAVAALPAEGKRAMEKWLSSPDKNIRWIMRENLKKNRLARMDPAWVARAVEQLAGG